MYPSSIYDFVLMFTDGICDDLLEENTKEFAYGVLKEFESVISDGLALDAPDWLVNWPVKGHLDDKTIALMTRKITCRATARVLNS